MQPKRRGVPGLGDPPGSLNRGTLSYDELLSASASATEQATSAQPVAPEQQQEQIQREDFEELVRDPFQERQPLQPEAFQGEMRSLTFDELMSTPEELAAAANEFAGHPFARQKRQLKALGADADGINSFDSYLSDMLRMPKLDRLKFFDRDVEQWENYGLTDQELDGIRQYLGIYNWKPSAIEKSGDIHRVMMEVEAQQPAAMLDLYESIKKPYRKYVTPVLKKVTDKERAALKWYAGSRLRGSQIMPSTRWHKESIKHNNWDAIRSSSKLGSFPTMGELGEDFIKEQMNRVAVEYADRPVEKETILNLLRHATTHPSATWLRRGEIPKWIDQKLHQDLLQAKPKLALPLMGLYAPMEYVGDYLTNAENYPEIAVMVAVNRLVINPATTRFLRYAATKKWGTLGLKDAYKFYRLKWKIGRAGTPRPMTNKTFMDFMNNLTNPNIKTHIKHSGLTDKQLDAALQYYQKHIPTLTKEQLPMMELLLRKTDGAVNLMVPKDPAALRFMAQDVGAWPTPTVGAPQLAPSGIRPLAAAPPNLLMPPPLGGTPGPAELAVQFPTNLALTEDAAAADLDSRIAAAAVGANRLATQTQYSPDDILFMRTMGMTDDQIIQQAREEGFDYPDISFEPQVEDRVIIPSMGYKEGRLTNIDDPAKMEVMFDNGMRMTVPQGEVYHADQLKQRTPVPRVSPQNEAVVGRKIANNQPVSQAELESAPTILKEMGRTDLANQAIAKRKARDAQYNKQLHKESKAVTTSNIEEVGAIDTYTHVHKPTGAEIVPGEAAPEVAAAEATLDKTVTEARDLAAQIQEPTETAAPTLPLELDETGIERAKAATQKAIDMIEAPVTEPAQWVMDDGTPLHQVPLNEYLLQGEPPQLKAIKASAARRLGFDAVPTRIADRYVEAVGRTVKQHIPDKIKEFTELKTRYMTRPGTVKAAEFEKFIGEQHKLAARVTFQREMEATGLTDPESAALATHRQAVQEAVASGKEVPDAVLADYPDIRRGLVEKSQLTSTPTEQLNTDLASRGYADADIHVLSETDKEWLISNDIDPNSITILDSGQIANIPEADRPINHPEVSRGKTHGDLENDYKEQRNISRIIADAWDDEQGFLMIPGGETLKRLSVLWSRLNKRINMIGISAEDDMVRSLESSIDKWAGEIKMAEINADWQLEDFRQLRKVIPTLTKPVFRGRGQNKVKLFDSEEELIVRYMDDPEYHANDLQYLSSGARKLLDILRADYQEAYRIAKQHGILNEWIENYTFRMYKDSPEKIASIQFGDKPRAMGQRPSFTRKRKYATLRDAEDVGLHPIFDPGLLNSTYHLALNRAIAHRNMLNALMMLQDSQGLPAIMAKPNPGHPYMKFWNDSSKYVTLSGFKALERRVVVPLPGKRGLFVRVEAKAQTEIAERLKQVFDPMIPAGRAWRNFMNAKHIIQRGKMWNFLIHRANIYSDKLDEFNFRVMKIFRYQRKAKAAWKRRDERVLRMVQNNLFLDSSREIATTMKGYQRQSAAVFETIMAPLPAPLNKMGTAIKHVLDKADDFLWDYVRYSQISMCELLTQKFMESNPTWSEDQAMRVAAHYTNLNLGRIPPHWMHPRLRKIASTTLFAPGWTVSNVSMGMAAYPFNPGRFGLGTKGFSDEQRRVFGQNFLHHIIKGALALTAMSSVFTMMNIHAQNQAKERGLMDGEPMPVRPPWLFAERRNWFDLWLYRDKRGQNVFAVNWLFRYIQDMIKVIDTPKAVTQHAFNKSDVMLKMGIEAVTNYQRWRESEIIPDGATGWDEMKEGVKWFAWSILPGNLYADKPHREADLVDWIAPFSGTWLRRSTPGGKIGALIRKYEAETRYEDNKKQNQLSKALDRGDWEEAMRVGMTIYATPKDAQAAIQRKLLIRKFPINYLMKEKSEKEQLEFFKWLEDNGHGVFKKTYTPSEIAEQMLWELRNAVNDRDAELQLEEATDPRDSSKAPERINEDVIRRFAEEGNAVQPPQPEQSPATPAKVPVFREGTLSFDELLTPQ
jgi:uncharacterized protein (DUF433 family)